MTLPPLVLLRFNLPQSFRKTNLKFHDKLTLFIHIIVFLFSKSTSSDLGTAPSKISTYDGRISGSLLEQMPQNFLVAAETVGIEI